MPFKSEKIILQGTKLDRRVKLTPEQRSEIKSNPYGLSQRKLAAMYEVSRRTITFILDPEKLAENLKRREEKGGSKFYYKKESHTKAIREHRRYKQDLLVTGKAAISESPLKVE